MTLARYLGPYKINRVYYKCLYGCTKTIIDKIPDESIDIVLTCPRVVKGTVERIDNAVSVEELAETISHLKTKMAPNGITWIVLDQPSPHRVVCDVPLILEDVGYIYHGQYESLEIHDNFTAAMIEKKRTIHLFATNKSTKSTLPNKYYARKRVSNDLLRCLIAYGKRGYKVIVVDPFAYRGQVGVATKQIGMTFVGFEERQENTIIANTLMDFAEPINIGYRRNIDS